MKSGIYKIVWPNGYFYFGQSSNINNRKSSHFGCLKKGTHSNCIMQNLFNKHGLPLFEVVELLPISSLDFAEQGYIDTYIKNKKCCNISKNVEKNALGLKRSLESKKKISLARRGSILSEYHKKAIGLGLKIAYDMGVRNKPNLNGANNPFFGKTHSVDFINRISLYRKGLLIGERNGRSKDVLDLETGIFYGSIIEAAESVNQKGYWLRKKLIRGTSHRFVKL